MSRTRAVPGAGPPTAQIVLVGEAPGREEDHEGRPFVGAAGRVLDRALLSAGIRREDVYITSAVKCRPPRNRRPSRDEEETCRAYLTAQVHAIRPRVVVAMGQTAVRAMLGPGIALSTVRGRWRKVQGVTVLSTYHPAAILYNRPLFAKLARDLASARRRAEG
jgi:DNA polymerase